MKTNNDRPYHWKWRVCQFIFLDITVLSEQQITKLPESNKIINESSVVDLNKLIIYVKCVTLNDEVFVC